MKLSKPNNTTPVEKKPFLSFGGAGKPKPYVDPDTYVYKPTLPTVNVIPRELTQKYEIKGVTRKIIGVGIGIVAVFGIVFAGATVYAGSLDQRLDAIKADQDALTEQVVALTPYQDYKTAVENKRKTLSDEVSSDVNFGVIWGDLNAAATEAQIGFDNVSILQDDTAITSCTNPDVFSQPENIIGCINIQGKSSSAGAVNTFMDILTKANNAGEGKYARPFVSTISTSEEGQTSFTASVFFTNLALSGQYSTLELAIDDLISGTTTESDAFSTQTAKALYTLAPDISSDVLSKVESIAIGACKPDGDVKAAQTQIQELLETSIPDTAGTIFPEVNQVLANECATAGGN